MDPVKRKVISELFFAPSVVLPIVGGLSAALLSWAGNGVDALTAVAAVGILGGIGWMATRVIFQVEKLTEEALQIQLRHQVDRENATLDQLYRELVADGDPRTQDYLTLLRSCREDFWQASNQPGIQQRSAMVRMRVEEVFNGAVESLRETLRLLRQANSVTGELRKKILSEREELMQELSKTVESLRESVAEFRSLAGGTHRTNVTSIREELEASIEAAKRTEQRMREWEQSHSRKDHSSLDT